jgi:acetyltransferase-like isoleucine patch superfamily enzyme
LKDRISKKWAAFWMQRAGITFSGRMAARLAGWFAPPYKGRTFLAHITRDGYYIAPSAAIHHDRLDIAENVFIGERVVIYQADRQSSVRIGRGTHIHSDTIIETGLEGRLIIGSDTHVQPRCQFSAYAGSIEIADRVQIAPFCAFYPYNHSYVSDDPIKSQPLRTKGGIVIEDDVLLSVGVYVLDGVNIGKGAVIGAGAVVTKNIPAKAIACGNPARVIQYRKQV